MVRDWRVGVMLWRIGSILNIDEQMDWLIEHRFEAVAFHAAPGQPPDWKGVDPAAADTAERTRLRERIAAFVNCEIHAPFHLTVTAEDGDRIVADLIPVLQFSAEIGAQVVTVHGIHPGGRLEQRSIGQGKIDPSVLREPIKARKDRYLNALNTLNQRAREAGVQVAMELHEGFEVIGQVEHDHLGINLDVGHMHHDGGIWYEPYGGFHQLVTSIGAHLIHAHIHDTDQIHDHIEIGAGVTDFGSVMEAFAAIDYPGFFVIEPAPNYVTPEGIIRGRDLLKQKMHLLA